MVIQAEGLTWREEKRTRGLNYQMPSEDQVLGSDSDKCFEEDIQASQLDSSLPAAKGLNYVSQTWGCSYKVFPVRFWIHKEGLEPCTTWDKPVGMTSEVGEDQTLWGSSQKEMPRMNSLGSEASVEVAMATKDTRNYFCFVVLRIVGKGRKEEELLTIGIFQSLSHFPLLDIKTSHN